MGPAECHSSADLSAAPIAASIIERRQEAGLNIGMAAHRSGLNPKTIRYYESKGLIPSRRRQANGYRDYTEADVHTLSFVKRARSLGFSVQEVAEPLSLWRNRRRSSATVKASREDISTCSTERFRSSRRCARP